MTLMTGQRCTLCKLVKSIKLEGAADIPDGSAAIQKNLSKLEKMGKQESCEDQQKEMQSSSVGEKYARHRYSVGSTGFVEKAPVHGGTRHLARAKNMPLCQGRPVTCWAALGREPPAVGGR